MITVVRVSQQDTKTIMMTNNTLLPINWKLSGLENLGEDFSVSAESGTIPPLTTLPFDAFFRAQKVGCICIVWACPEDGGLGREGEGGHSNRLIFYLYSPV